jgi:phytoene dehydrogenase-like protein
MHAYIAVPFTPSDPPLECHHSVIMDWGKKIDAKQNMVIISIPTVFDPSLAPEGFHIIHAYTAASDDFDEFKGFLKDGEKPDDGAFQDGSFAEPNCYKNDDYAKNPDYIALKEKQSQVLFDAIARVIPDIRERVKHEDAIVEIGTPLTHRRFNRRAYGAYGPGVDEDGSVWSLLQSKSLNMPGLYLCGDSTFPGIGIPGVAASGTIAANSFVGIREHNRELSRSRKANILQ